jgi:hypothetical protein
MNILDPRFRYTPAAKTDLKRTFARIRREQAAAQTSAPTSERIAQAEAAVQAAALVRLPAPTIKRVA